MLLTITAAIIVLGVLIFVHELGHFMAAKAVGIGVPRFSIGLGPSTPLSFRRGETEYVISWIPFGGYVKMATKEEDPVLEGGPSEQPFAEHQMFETKPLWARILVISAGVIMNAVFAVVVHSALLAAYGRVEERSTAVGEVVTDSLPPSAQTLATIPYGARIIRINQDTVRSWQDVIRAFLDPSPRGLHIEFAEPVLPVTLAIDGYDMEERQAALLALPPLQPAAIGSVDPGTAASEAGFRAGDLVFRVGQDTVRSWAEMVEIVRTNAGAALAFNVQRGDSIVALTATPRAEQLTDPTTGEVEEIGLLGVRRDVYRVRVGLGSAMVGGFRQTVADSRLILFALRGLLTGRIPASELGGPVLIGQLSGETARAGLPQFLSFMALFSINLAILNLLPIPVLDGGQLVFLFAEGVRGKPLSLGLRLRLTQFGLVILLGIMVLALTNDLLRVFR